MALGTAINGQRHGSSVSRISRLTSTPLRDVTGRFIVMDTARSVVFDMLLTVRKAAS
jgi:hypothetical protein